MIIRALDAITTVSPGPATPITMNATLDQYIILYGAANLGIYYISDNPTVNIVGYDGNWGGQSQITIGGSQWWAFDEHGIQVGQGTLNTAANNFNVSTNGTWIGGTTMQPGYYQIVTNNGAAGTVCVCPPTVMYKPQSQYQLGAWFGTGPDRYLYSFNADNVEAMNATDIVANLKADPYFTSAQDPARPRTIWIAPQPAAINPTQSPTTAEWQNLASTMVAGGFPGAWYELPTNEPEDGGWPIASIVTYYNAARAAILAGDPTAHTMGYDSGGYFNNSSDADMGTFFSGATGIDAISGHMEDSNQNASNLVGLKQYYTAMKSRLSRSSLPNLPYWSTETGILGGGFDVLNPRRDARQRLVLRMVCEAYGWSKERQYDFAYQDIHGSGLPMFIYDSSNGATGDTHGQIRAGGYALHVMAEALWGTTCTVASPPAQLNFGASGSVGDNLYYGLHYTGTTRDVVMLATNGIESDTIRLTTNATGSVTAWDAWGKPSTIPVVGGIVGIPVDDLVTYVFFPTGSTINTVTNWWSVEGEKLGNWTSTQQAVTGSVPGVTAAIQQNAPYTFSLTVATAAKGFALSTIGPAYQDSGCSFTNFDILDSNNNILYHWQSNNAQTLPYRSASTQNCSDVCNYTTFWTHPSSWLVQVPIPAGTVKLRVNATGYGGQPDALGDSVGHQDNQVIKLAAFQVLR